MAKNERSNDRENERHTERLGDDAATGSGTPPFRSSGSGASYSAGGNWAAERRTDNPSGGAHGMEGAPSGAGDGGFGPEGDYRGAAGQPNADIVGQANSDNQALIDEAHEEGPRKPGRKFTN